MKPIFIKKLSIKINAFILSCFVFNLNYVFSGGCCDCLSSNSGGKGSKSNLEGIQLSPQDIETIKTILKFCYMSKTSLLINSRDYGYAGFLNDSVGLIDKIQSRQDFVSLVSKFNCVKAQPLKNYNYLADIKVDKNLFFVFSKRDELFFEVSFILKTQGFEINIPNIIKLYKGGNNALSDYYSRLSEADKLVLFKFDSANDKCEIYNCLVDMDTLAINGYKREHCTDINKAIASIALNNGKTCYLIGSFDDLKNFDINTFKPKYLFTPLA